MDSRKPQAEKRKFCRINTVTLCSVCDAVYSEGNISLPDTILPCGHKAARWMMASCIHDGQAAEDFINWADRKDLLDRAYKHLEQRGGKYDPSHNGPGGFVAPAKDKR